MLRIPAQWLPQAPGTAILGFSPDASEIIAYSHHDGSKIRDISVDSPGDGKLFLPSFFKDNSGLHYLEMSALVPVEQ